jgi:hypothetical protein
VIGVAVASISDKLLGAGAEAKNEWAEASAATSLEFTGEAQFRRGVEVQIGLNALATASAGLSRFVDTTVRGNAFAEATASLQYQLPLNLFDEFGLAVGAQAVAQAAAGIEAGLGLAVGDFLALVRNTAESAGLPADLVALLLEEAVVGGTFEVHVAAAAMAYASIRITGEVVQNPGFRVFVDAGLGLAAGVGFSGSLDLTLNDFRRFYGRAVDKTVGAVVDGAAQHLVQDADRFTPVLRALTPVASTALRIAYEIGHYITKNSPGNDRQSALDLSNHCVGILLEESQRFLFGQFAEAGLRSLERLVERDVPGLAQGVWEGLKPRRQSVALALRQMPAEPFQPTAENAAYWADLVAQTADLLSTLPAAPRAGVTRGLSIVFAAAQLLTEAVRRKVNTAEAYAFAFGSAVTAPPTPPFTGTVQAQPGVIIERHINEVLGRAPGTDVDFGDLVAYLADELIVTTLRETIPDIDTYLAIFDHPAVGDGVSAVAKVLLRNREAFIGDNTGKRDPQETLRVLLGLIDDFLTTKIVHDLAPALNSQIADANTKLYFNEVLLGTVLFAKDVAFRTVLDWEQRPIEASTFTEALAGIMTMLLGRSLVLVGDSFMTALQGDMERACGHAADQLESTPDPLAQMHVPASPELKALLATTLRIGGEVFGPLPAESRQRLRFVLYDVMETLPPGAAAQADLVANLADQFFLPNEESVHELSDELLAISRDRFGLFVERVVEEGARLILAQIEELVEQATEAVLAWAKDIGAQIKNLMDRIADLDDAIQRLLTQADQTFDTAVSEFRALLEQFGGHRLRDRLRDEIADGFYRKAKDVLATNGFYAGLPKEVRAFVRDVLRDVISDLVDGDVVDPIFTAIGGVADELGDVLDDVRDLNPDEPLEPQLLDLIVDRFEDGIRTIMGGSRPSVDIGFTVDVLGLSHHFSLGNVTLKFDVLFAMLRNAIATLDYYETQLQVTADALAAAFRTSLDLETAQVQRDRRAAERNRLDAVRSDFSTATKTIGVVSPGQSVVYSDAVDVQIQLGGVPRSYLGLREDEQQRVLVFLNGNLRDLNDFAVEVQQMEGTNSLLEPPLLGAIGAVPRPQAQDRSATAVRRDGPATRPPLHPTLRAAAANHAGSGDGPFTTRTTTAGRDGHGITTTRVQNVSPGRRVTQAKRADLLRHLPAGVALRLRVEPADMVAGTNTLAVVVIDPGGRRYQHVVSFGVTPAMTTRPGARLPTAPGRRPHSAPPPPPNGIDLHFDGSIIAERVKSAREALARRSGEVRRRDRRATGEPA